MRLIEIELETEIDAPAVVVWGLITDWENLDKWMPEGSDFRVTTPFREGVGVEAIARIKIGPFSTVDKISVSRWEPPHLLEIQHLGWVKGAGLLKVSKARGPRGMSKLYWRETFVAPLGVVGALGMRLYSPLMRKVFERDLGLLKKLAEREVNR